MTQKERLVELIDKMLDAAEDEEAIKIDCGYGVDLTFLADYLLSNGVIVPPCKVGDTVYVINNNNVDRVSVTEFAITDGGGVYYLGDCWDFDCEIGFTGGDIGKIVFETRAEAEQALSMFRLP